MFGTAAFSPFFISKRHPTEWGDAINYDGEGSQGVRDFVTENVAYWIREYHFDGLRLDATQSIYDDSARHLLADLTTAARAAAKTSDGSERKVIIIAENETQDVGHVEKIDNGGFGLDGLWNDDFHHSCRVAATGHAEYYYADFAGTAQELISATRFGYLFQGQYSHELRRWRGTPAWHVEGWRFITFLQNHDQVANSAHGSRLPELTSPGTLRQFPRIAGETGDKFNFLIQRTKQRSKPANEIGQLASTTRQMFCCTEISCGSAAMTSRSAAKASG